MVRLHYRNESFLEGGFRWPRLCLRLLRPGPQMADYAQMLDAEFVYYKWWA